MLFENPPAPNAPIANIFPLLLKETDQPKESSVKSPLIFCPT